MYCYGIGPGTQLDGQLILYPDFMAVLAKE